MATKSTPDHHLAQQIDRLFQMGDQLYKQGRYQESLVLATQLRDLVRQHLGQDHPDYARSLNNLAVSYLAVGDHAAALPLLRQAVEIERTARGENHPDYARSLFNLAESYSRMGDYAAALSAERQGVDIIRASLGECHPLYAQSLNNLALTYARMGKLSEALPLCRQAVELWRAALSENHPHYADGLRALASLYCGMRDYTAALPLGRQAADIHRAALGENHPHYGASLYYLANLYERMGDYGAALPLYRQALEIRRTALGENHPDYAKSLDTLALLYQAMGDYAAALPLLRRAVEIRRITVGENHPDYAESLGGLASFYHTIGDCTLALSLYRQALEVRRTALGESHPDYATLLTDLAFVYRDMGDHAAALPLSLQAVEIRRAAVGENHPQFADSLNNLANLYSVMGDCAAAVRLSRQAVEIRRTALGENHLVYADGLNDLALEYRAMGDFEAAIPLLRRAVEIRRTAQGENHPHYANCLNNLAVTLTATGRAPEALTLMEQAAVCHDWMFGQILMIGSDRQRLSYLNTVLGELHKFLSLVHQHFSDSPAAIRAALDLVLRRKAATAEALASQRAAVLAGKYRALEPKLRELTALRAQIARMTLLGPGPEGLDPHVWRLAEWNAQKERLEAELAGQIPELHLEQKLRAADSRAVALSLPEEVTLVEFVRFPVVAFQAVLARGEQEWKPPRYVAFILPGGAPDEVQMIDLGEAEPIDRLVAAFRAGVVAEAAGGESRDMASRREEALGTVESDAGLALRAALFDRLVPALGTRTRLLISPDGDLARLPFEVLPTSDGRRLIDDYQISYLSCGRDVLGFGADAPGQPDKPLVFADPDFDLEADEPPVPHPELAADAVGRHTRDIDRDRSAYHFHRLPGTRAEGERVACRLGVSPWLDAAALEGWLKAVCRSPRILHLATHGFFLPDQERDLNREGRSLDFDFGEFSGARDGPGRLSGPMMENPMLRSGLALAGANTWLRAGNLPEEAEDGLLTAEDVTGLDLLATELVVLSACETGLGQVHVGEGVFGLRRAFVLAGARTLVMSLWKVPDEPTRELMEDFYARLLAGEGRAEALRQAQLAMKAKYPEPFYWAAFICQGDPSPLGTARLEMADTGSATT
jgi:CHAT domain-containing protein/tetratricopeptide (TPR) repeat protein